MKTKRKSKDEKLQLIVECRNSGLSDYQWCKRNDINPSTFYNWISRLQKQGNEILEALSDEKKSPSKQEVVKLELVYEDTSLETKSDKNISSVESQTSIKQPSVEIVFENATVRFFPGIDQQFVAFL